MLESEGAVLDAHSKGVAKKGTLLYTSASAAFRSTATSAMLAAGKMALRGLGRWMKPTAQLIFRTTNVGHHGCQRVFRRVAAWRGRAK